MSGNWLLTNVSVLDPDSGTITPDQNIVVDNGVIADVDATATRSNAETIDLRGAVLMPGLIDTHVHVNAATADLSALPRMAPSFVALHAANELHSMLLRGFTSVRDCGGADYGVAEALRQGLITGPRLYYAGKALSQTGGHGDVRHPGDNTDEQQYCCPDFGRICDGVAECRRAAREELRKGATHLKVMLGGGVSSPTDRVDNTQFADEEITAIVDEAHAAHRYVAGHAYTPRAMHRGVTLGVRTIEHGNFLDDATASIFHDHDAFLVPTLVTYNTLAKSGPSAGLSPETHAKVFDVLDAGLRGLETARRNGLEIAFGTDLLGSLQAHQLTEFEIRAQVQQPAEIIRSATTVAARLLQSEGKLGTIAPGAHADLLAVDGNPLEDITVLTDPERYHRLVMAAGIPVRTP